ncbi:MAG: hypothetical protein IT533_15760 [Hyphomicrobiales bacterium]|nr:hypothetical protein [Hyphomicrobiales bacterium]
MAALDEGLHGGMMTDDDDTKRRKRIVRHTACFDTFENALLLMNVDVAGVSISSFLKSSALRTPLTRATRRPTVNQQMVSQVIAAMGEAATAFRLAAELADRELAEATMREFNERRIVVFQTMGREP